MLKVNILLKIQQTVLLAQSLIAQTTRHHCVLNVLPAKQSNGGCIQCRFGFFSPYGITCMRCANGTYSGIGDNICTPCLPGYYSVSSLGPEGCVKRPINYYSNLAGSTACSRCDYGTYTTGEGKAECVKCPCRGTSYMDGTCTACAAGTRGEVEGVCSNCTAGSYSKTLGSLECSACEGGTYSLPGSSKCSPCQIEDVDKLENILASYCTQCPQGTSPARGFCRKCALGKYSITGISCVSCPAGSYADKTGSDQCTPCEAGTYSSKVALNSSSECVPCGINYYTATPGSTKCFPCPSNLVAEVIGSTACTACEPGHGFSNGTCVPCEPGSYGFAGTCTPCQKGHYTPQYKSTQCFECREGTISSSVGAISCETCSIGFTSLKASSECIPCNIGEYSKVGGQCISCSAGSYSDTRNSTVCEVLWQHWMLKKMKKLFNHSSLQKQKYCKSYEFSSAGAAKCTLCSQSILPYDDPEVLDASMCFVCNVPGTRTARGGCKNCNPGTFSKFGGECSECAAGTYSNEGAASCTNCPIGTFSDKVAGSDITSCTNCSAGYYAPSTGTTSCLQCPIGKHMPFTGASICFDCSPGFYSELGSPSCSPCQVFNSSFTGTLTANKCTNCPRGSEGVNGGCRNCTVTMFWNSTTEQCEKCVPSEYSIEEGRDKCFSCNSFYSLNEKEQAYCKILSESLRQAEEAKNIERAKQVAIPVSITGGALILLLVFAIILVIVTVRVIKKRRQQMDSNMLQKLLFEHGTEMMDMNISCKLPMIPFEDLKDLEEIGSGGSGAIVLRGKLHHKDIVVKLFKASEQNISEFENELNLMSYVVFQC